jgi:hypothetical protein
MSDEELTRTAGAVATASDAALAPSLTLAAD